MLDRRQNVRGKVQGSLTDFDERGLTIMSDFREGGASIDSGTGARRTDEADVRIARRGSTFLGRLISRQVDKIGLAFRMMTADEPVSDLDERLRRSEIKKRQLQRRIDELLGRE